MATMQALNLPTFEIKTKSIKGKTFIFDVIRKKYVALTPEEWVRQHILHFLVVHKNYPSSLIAVEAGLKLNGLNKRADLIVYDKLGIPFLIVECKAPEVKISQDTFDQIARYNVAFNVKYLVVTNGMHHYCCKIDYETNNYTYLQNLPEFE